MNCRDTILRLIKALVLWVVLGLVIFILLFVFSRLFGWYCGIEWVALAALFVLHLLGAAAGPILWNKEREGRFE